jgi:two-component sensor histidine kinase
MRAASDLSAELGLRIPFSEITGKKGTQTLRLVLCALLVLLGAAVALGWWFNVPVLKSVLPGFSTMKFNTAVGFMLTGIGLGLCCSRGLARPLAAVVGLLVAALGAATMLEYAFDVNLGIDEMLFHDSGTLIGSGHPGRMSLLTAFAFTVLGPAILLLALATHRREIIIAHGLAMLAGAVSVLAAAGYAFGAEAFWGLGFYTFIAVHTAAGLLVAGAAALMTRAQEGWLEPYVESPAALALLGRTLPIALIVPLFIGLLIMLGAGLGAYNAPFGLALFIPAMSVAIVLVALWVAAKQRDSELIRLRYERHLQLVVAELNHRVKNTLSIVQSFAHQSLKGATSPEQARAGFEGRLTALASAHNMLTRENWDRVSLVELIGNSLDVHNDTGTRFAIHGPDLSVSPKTSVTLAMTLHELATNSMKYGALSAPGGFARISWGLEDGEFHFEWQDCNGPPCAPPARRGFGSRMLERALASELDGSASIHFDNGGFRYELRAPARAEL